MLFDEEKHTQRQQKIDIWKPVLIKQCPRLGR